MPKPYAYYNEFDKDKAEWLQNLMDAGQIAPGDIDTRSIEDVQPADLLGYTQHHFFAGIGVWSAALRKAGWPDDSPVWTFSCPCPPFSTAGKGQECPSCGGRSHLCHPSRTGYFICLDCGHSHFADARHLYPEISRLAREYRPAAFFGEQVASGDGRTWLATVRADMENMGYAVGGTDLCSAGIGAFNIRQRIYFAGYRLGDTGGEGLEERIWNRGVQREAMETHQVETGKRRSDSCGMADPNGYGAKRRSREDQGQERTPERKGHQDRHSDDAICTMPDGRMADTEGKQCKRSRNPWGWRTGPANGRNQFVRMGNTYGKQQEEVTAVHAGCPDASRADMDAWTGQADGGGRPADWLFCRDGK
ncbi:DNA cytosine methyltransferase [Sulfurimonas sp. ST-25]|uniref:DNA cytosine methyltransferase n=1 Tax=Sulfurimonas sp. ST-25 TaxID=3400151 RepID=UPI003A8AD2AA